MSYLKRTLTDLAERGTPIGSERLRERVILDLASDLPSTRRGTPEIRRPAAVLVAAAAATLILVGVVPLLVGLPGREDLATATTTSATVDQATPATTPPADALAGPVLGTGGVAIASDGGLWFATGNGVVRWDLATGAPVVFTEADGLPTREIYTLVASPDGTIWVAADGRLARYDGAWTVIPDDVLPLRQPFDEIGGLAAGPDGTVWIAAGTDRLLRFDGMTAAEVSLPRDMGGSPWAQSLAVAPDGTLWVVTNDESGVFAFDGAAWTAYTEADGLFGTAGNIVIAPDGAVWVGSSGSGGIQPAGIARFDGSEWTMFTTADGLLSNEGHVIVARDGTVWAIRSEVTPEFAQQYGIDATPGGLSRFDGSRWTAYPGAAASGRAVAGANGTLWMASLDELVGFDGANTTHLLIPADLIPPPEPAPVETTSTTVWDAASIDALPAGAVAITVTGLESVPGWQIGGVLYRGPGQSYPDERVVGGFSASVDGDPFTTTDVMHKPDDEWSWTLFPNVTDEMLIVEPGTYTVVVYVSNWLRPYGRWVPACVTDVILYEQEAQIEVAPEQSVWATIEFDISRLRNRCGG